jgi:hypothetical protein
LTDLNERALLKTHGLSIRKAVLLGRTPLGEIRLNNLWKKIVRMRSLSFISAQI